MCWPSVGEGPCTLSGVSLIWSGAPTIFTGPASGCSTVDLQVVREHLLVVDQLVRELERPGGHARFVEQREPLVGRLFLEDAPRPPRRARARSLATPSSAAPSSGRRCACPRRRSTAVSLRRSATLSAPTTMYESFVLKTR